MQLKTVLCPIDFSNLSRQEIALGTEVSRSFGARLVLHHNRAAATPGFARAWEWDAAHRGPQEQGGKVDERLKELLRELPPEINAEASVGVGPVAPLLLDLAQRLPADLMVLGSHGWSTPDHASVTERLIDSSPCPVLTVHDGVRTDRFRLRAGEVDVLVATDLTETGAHAMAYAFELARLIPMRVHVLHVTAHGADTAILDTVREQLYGLVPPDLATVAPLEAIRSDDQEISGAGRAAPTEMSTVECYVRRGDPIDEILLFGEHLDPTFLMMGEHAPSFFRRHFTRDSAVEVMHRAPWPVWFVPAR